MTEHKMSRRNLLKTAGATAAGAVAAPVMITAKVSGQHAPGNRITMGFIGVGGGGMGVHNLRSFLPHDDCQVVAVCDVDAQRVRHAAQIINDRYGNTDCAVYVDFRELLQRKDIDAVCISTPDHWHAIMAVAAARAGKDIYGEKPLAHTLHEGRAIVDAVQRYGRVWQTGSWQRSQANFRQACELVRNGAIGKVHTIEVGLPVDATSAQNRAPQHHAPPEHLNWDRWLGPAPWQPYDPSVVHFHWRWHHDFGGGALMDWISHHLDIAHWAMDWDHTGPVELQGFGQFMQQGVFNAAHRFRINCLYETGETVVVAGNDGIATGTRWIGDAGWIHVDRGHISADPGDLLQTSLGSEAVYLKRSPGHQREFLDCIRTRGQTLTHVESAHRSASVGQLCQIAITLGRKITWDPKAEQILNDPTANRMLGKAYRSPWML